MLFHDEVLKKIPSKFIWVGISFVFFSNTQGRLGISATTKKIPTHDNIAVFIHKP